MIDGGYFVSVIRITCPGSARTSGRVYRLLLMKASFLILVPVRSHPLHFDKPLILINRQLDKQTKQMVCGYALGHYLEHQLLMDLHTLNKFLTIKDKHILLYEHNAFTSHLMLDSDEVYQMTKRGLDATQIAAVKKIHLNLVLVKLLELHHLGYDLRHYHEQHHAFIEHFKLPRHFRFDVA